MRVDRAIVFAHTVVAADDDIDRTTAGALGLRVAAITTTDVTVTIPPPHHCHHVNPRNHLVAVFARRHRCIAMRDLLARLSAPVVVRRHTASAQAYACRTANDHPAV